MCGGGARRRCGRKLLAVVIITERSEWERSDDDGQVGNGGAVAMPELRKAG